MLPELDGPAVSYRMPWRAAPRLQLRPAAVVVALLTIASSAAGQPFAYVTSPVSDAVSVIDTSTNKVVGPPIRVGYGPGGAAITPDGLRLYVSNTFGNDVSVVDTVARTVIGAPIPVVIHPDSIAASPDGQRMYAVNCGALHDPDLGKLSVIDVATNTVVGAPIPLSYDPGNSIPNTIAVTPDATRAYVSNTSTFGGGFVSVVDLKAGTLAQTIPIDHRPFGLAINPSGRLAYTANDDGTVSVVDTCSDEVIVAAIPVGRLSTGIAVTPDGRHAYVADLLNNAVSVIDASTNTVVGSQIPVGGYPRQVAITPDGARAYVTDDELGAVTVIDTAKNVAIATIPVGEGPVGIAIQPPPTCVADCDSDGMVTVDELVASVGIALDGASVEHCAASDCNRRGAVTIDCLVKGVNAALDGCPVRRCPAH